ncbi:MAG: lactate racemase [Chthoniobacter sp.]|jgi:nickel-dependent lactate racemase|nr:lactate racemase [Chthoniobacter sp.]
MKIPLAYGRAHLAVEFPDGRTTVIEPAHAAGLPDEKSALFAALDAPIASPPLRERVGADTRICITFTDITRATPNERLIPWLLEYLETAGVRRDRLLLLNQLGTHRPNTREELEGMLTSAVVESYRVLNHEPENPEALAEVGRMRDGVTPALINKHALAADLRIVTGFIEPHFFAGFSGGPKGIIPGVAGLQSVMASHQAAHIGDPRATFGQTEGNPLWEELRDIATSAAVGPSFLLNVTLNDERGITGIFAGDLRAAHRRGCEFVRTTAMQPVDAPFEVVVTTNSGYPLDMNLYQGVKGMSAAARIVREGGLIILVCECGEGVPDRSPFDQILRGAACPEEILANVANWGQTRPEQWQAQIQALVQRKARVLIYSSLPEETVQAAHLGSCRDIAATVGDELERRGPQARVAVLPQGPLTIPYLAPG